MKASSLFGITLVSVLFLSGCAHQSVDKKSLKTNTHNYKNGGNEPSFEYGTNEEERDLEARLTAERDALLEAKKEADNLEKPNS
ncbi:MAG: hypothetical protein MJK10_15380 [Pseudomonadales bacterium]|nr:hypothetical protein [Pseudomonadales bacterium]NRA17615.1 hypothetical protein [Oceanospirillaceae bacterium]